LPDSFSESSPRAVALSGPEAGRSLARSFGEVPASEWTQKACRRQLDDLDRKGLAYRFDENLRCALLLGTVLQTPPRRALNARNIS